MSQINQFKLERLNSAGTSVKGIKFHFGSTNSDNITFNNISFAQPNASADNNYISNLGGFKRLVSIDFALFNDGTDKSTDSSSKVTLTQQISNLMASDGILQGKASGESLSDVTFRLTVYEDGASLTYNGVLEDFTLDKSSSNGNIVRGSLTLQVGSN